MFMFEIKLQCKRLNCKITSYPINIKDYTKVRVDPSKRNSTNGDSTNRANFEHFAKFF